jgi:biopolymer transport protein ExbB
MPTLSASFIASLTLWILASFSVITWTQIILRALAARRMARLDRRFGQAFWATRDLAVAASLSENADGPLARVGRAGFTALRELNASDTRILRYGGDAHAALEASLRQQIQQEQNGMESGLMLLASIGNTAPFVGLFGTVLGIMHALAQIGASGSARLDVVAGPIGEALTATAIGIATAVPAVLAYNYGLRHTRLYVTRLEDYASSFLRVACRPDGPRAEVD